MSRRQSRRHGYRRRQRTPAYLVCLGTVAAMLSLLALTVVIAQPRWTTPLFGQPFGVYLLGTAAALVTLSICYRWPRRIGDRHPRLVMTVTAFRVLSASFLAAGGYAAASGLVAEEWTAWGAAALLGLAEKPLNDAILSGLGVAAPAGSDSAEA